MTVIIVVLLYFLFLRNTLIESYPDMDGMSQLIDTYVLVGILSIVPVTTPAGFLQTMVEDKVNGRMKDLLVTTMRAHEIAAGYILNIFLVRLMMSPSRWSSALHISATRYPLSVSGIGMSAILLIPSSLSGSIIMYA